MTEVEPGFTFGAPVWAAFRRRCHRFLRLAYEQALERIRTEPAEETDITGYICEALEEWFRANPGSSYLFFVKDDPPVRATTKTGKRRPRSDIIIGYAAGNRPEFFFEAKRLHRLNAGRSKYAGKDGLGCFVTGRYAKGYSEAGMIGYLQTDTPEHWRFILKEKVRGDGKKLKLRSIDEETLFEDSFPLEWASTHGRDGVMPVRVLHILLDCRKDRV